VAKSRFRENRGSRKAETAARSRESHIRAGIILKDDEFTHRAAISEK